MSTDSSNLISREPALAHPGTARPAGQEAAPELAPDKILQLGLGFWGSKALLSAVELGVFTELRQAPLDGESLRARLGLHPRGAQDFFDALVALGMLQRELGLYRNTPESAVFLDRNKPSYIGGLLEMANARLYPSWGDLTSALKTGQPQNESKQAEDTFAELYSNPARLKQFLAAMTGISMGAARSLAQQFPWESFQTFIDVGGAQGCVSVQLALAHPHLPKADVLIMGHILHDWDLEQKRNLIAKAYAALPPGGALVIYDAIIDDERRRNAFGLLMSLNMLV